MSILDTFYILFKADTSELKKGVETAEKEVNRVEKDLEHLSKTSDKVGDSFHNLLQSTVGLFAGFASFHAVLSGAQGAIESIRKVGDASRELNVDVSALDAWGHAVQRTGGSAEGFQHSLEGLAEHFGTTNEIALRVLPRLADMFSRLNPRNAQVYGKSLGIDQATILLLQQGRREVEDTIKQQQRLGLVTKQQVEITRKFDNALYDAGRAYQNFSRELITPLLPGFTKAFNYAIDHKDAVADAFKVISAAVALLTLSLVRLNPELAIVVGGLTAISGAYALVKDDLKAYREGRPSVTARLGGAPDKIDKGLDFTEVVLKTSFKDQLLNSFKYGAPFLGNQSKSTTVNIGAVNVVTQATDANGMASGAADSLDKHISQVINNTDNGIAK